MIRRRFNFMLAYSVNWIVQISFISAIYFVKFMKLSHRFSLHYVLNNLIESDSHIVDDLINKELVLFSEENNILYKEHKPKINNYGNKKILFIGGRNGYNTNLNFAELLCNNIGITVVSFQYNGYYASGKSKYLNEEIFLNTIQEIYDIISYNSDVYCIGYSMGCYGAHYINKKEKVFLISPFYSLQKTLRDTINISHFNLNFLLERKYTDEVIIHSFYQDLINPHSHLVDNFQKTNVKLNKHHGNHVTGISDFLINEIIRYIN